MTQTNILRPATVRRLSRALVCIALALCGCTAQAPMPVAPNPTARQDVFRVEERDGLWAMIDPEGQPFFSIGINCINPADKDDNAGPKYQGLSKHGGNLDRWQKATLARLRDWRINTIGAWSSLRGRPYVLEFSLSYSWCDVFGDVFEAYVENAARTALKRPDVAADFATLDRDPMLIGYFTDNELIWGEGYGWQGDEQCSLFEYYASLEPPAAGKKAWVAYLSDVYRNNWAEFSLTWNVTATTPDELTRVVKIEPRSRDRHAAAKSVADGFMRRVAERYFEVTSRVMHQNLPHHLNLGCRFTTGFPDVVADVAARYVDVHSFNKYSRDLAAFRAEVVRLHAASRKPVLVTEFAFVARANRSGNTNKGYDRAVVADDRERGQCYARAAEMLADLPFVVGFHWFQYYDEPTGGRKDGENCNFGFVDVEDRVYEDLVNAAATANSRVLERHSAAWSMSRARPPIP